MSSPLSWLAYRKAVRRFFIARSFLPILAYSTPRLTYALDDFGDFLTASLHKLIPSSHTLFLYTAPAPYAISRKTSIITGRYSLDLPVITDFPLRTAGNLLSITPAKTVKTIIAR